MTNFRNAMMAAAYTASASGVTIDNSALFNSANSEDLSRGSMSGTATTWTASFWVYRGDNGQRTSADAKFMFTTASDAGLAFGNNSTANVLAWYGGSYVATTAVFRDIGWYHMVVKNVAGTGTVYVNGTAVLSSLTVPTADATMAIGSYNNSSSYLDGYMAEWVFIDGTALEPTSFAEYDSTGTFWTPKSSDVIKALTFGTNGFYLDNTTNAQTDASGEGNNFTNNNTVTTTSLMSPTKLPRLLWNPLSPLFSATLTEGNTKIASSGVHQGAWANTNFPKTGKWQTEVLVTLSGASAIVSFAIMKNSSSESLNQYIGDNSDSYGFYAYPTELPFYSAGTELFDVGAVSRGTYKYQICWDASAGDGTADVYFGIDNTFYDNDGSTDGNPATGANPTIENLDISTSEWSLLGIPYDAGTLTTADEADWEYSIQAGYTALNLTNIAKSVTRTKSNLGEYFETTIYEGTGAEQNVVSDTTTNTSAFSWIKNRDASDNHMLFDRVRGIHKDIHANDMVAQVTNVNTLQAFLNGGVQVGNDAEVNTNNESFVLWNWMMETAGSGTSNTDGSINTTATLVDTNIGLSISQYTGTGNNATVGHGLGVAPEFIIVKKQNSGSAGDSYYCYHVGLDATAPATKRIILNSSAGLGDDNTYWNDTEPTSSVFSLGTTSNVNGSGTVYISYAFAPSQFTAIGSYVGNENVNGTFVPTINSAGVPIQPVWVMVKNSVQARSWNITDTARNPYNVANLILEADTTTAQQTGSNTLWNMDIVTGGFKLRSSHETSNGAETLIYLAFGTPIIDVNGRIITGR